ncbi:hypothetical protein EH243_07410 [Amphritea opalescens]|uniref:Uncharacterized protein n=2 Tax=Amphritea opalescens TaxID=2490544 RepID=A0A430KSN7_9GAMM|nr:hypothetical protein EH243_07410 [Amphritea opalescens]
MKIKYLVVFSCLSLLSSPSMSGEADVIAVKVQPQAGHRYDFSVTVNHADSGWDHYANRWEILDGDGKIIASRVLLHPHVSEQPFTRSLSGVEIPAGVTQVRVRAHDLVHQYGGAELVVDLVPQ